MKENLLFKKMPPKPIGLVHRCKHYIPDLSESWQLKNGILSRVRGPAPTIKRPNEVLVKVQAASVNPLGKSSKQFLLNCYGRLLNVGLQHANLSEPCLEDLT